MHTPADILKQYWRHSGFRPMQEEIIHCILEGKDALALLPTGGGKSICFQVPALLMEGVCLVISPLIALMKDQVANLQQKGIAATAVHSGLTTNEVAALLAQAAQGDWKFLYLSPERLQTSLFLEYLPSLKISLVTVDEAHCISQWGYDFRPAYLQIAQLRQQLPGVPVLALTASATPQVQQDILLQLGMAKARVYRQSFERPALSYSVVLAHSKLNKLSAILSRISGSSLVYCSSRRQAKAVAHALQQQQVSADFYHAGLTPDERDQRQQAWLKQETRVMVCTNAFGMGIDKPDVRSVVHYDVPDCLENYYQEAGRAGRDGKKAYAVLLYQLQDVQALLQLPDIRFPSLPDIRKVYQALADYLQVPVGAGQDRYYDFDLHAFLSAFNLDMHLAINAIKVLEQEGHLAFSEQIFLPSRAGFTASRQQLEEVQAAYPALDPLTKCLLRTYQGIFNNQVPVFEKQLARLCRLPVETVVQQLQQLKGMHILEYLPLKNTPQLRYLLNRAPAAYLSIRQEAYLLRKKLYVQRVATMQEYLVKTAGCRSSWIGRYFGDLEVKACGICDTCLQQKKQALPGQVFTQIEQLVYNTVREQPLPVKLLLEKLQAYGSEQSWQVIHFLLAERKIRMDEFGTVSPT